LRFNAFEPKALRHRDKHDPNLHRHGRLCRLRSGRAYALAAILLVGLVVVSLRQLRKVEPNWRRSARPVARSAREAEAPPPLFVVAGMVLLGVAAGLTLYAMNDTLVFF